MSIHQKFCKINLEHTNYEMLPNARLLKTNEIDIDYLQNIFRQYCTYKNFDSVMPLFDSEFEGNDIIAYFYNNKIEAFTMVGVYDDTNCESYQFCWTYHDPNLRLGIESMKHECAYYKSLGFKYYYLGPPGKYKSQLEGYEVCGKL